MFLLSWSFQSELSHDVVQSVLREYRLHSCDVIVREDVTIDQFIDVVEGNRKYMPCLYVMNKIDQARIGKKRFTQALVNVSPQKGLVVFVRGHSWCFGRQFPFLEGAGFDFVECCDCLVD